MKFRAQYPHTKETAPKYNAIIIKDLFKGMRQKKEYRYKIQAMLQRFMQNYSFCPVAFYFDKGYVFIAENVLSKTNTHLNSEVQPFNWVCKQSFVVVLKTKFSQHSISQIKQMLSTIASWLQNSMNNQLLNTYTQ